MLTRQAPDIGPVLKPMVETRPKAVVEWLDRLPFASPMDAAQQLLDALHALNRHPLGGDARHALLVLYHPVVARAAASLEALLAESGVPPHAQQRQTGALLRELLTEYSIGYKRLLLALSQPPAARSQGKRLAEVAARLLAALRDLQIACYLTYSPPAPGLWQEMHQIYRLVQDSGLADLAVDETPPAGLVYRQALLLALADPPHMSRAELAHTRLYLDKLGALAVLSPAPADPAHHSFVVATDSDRGPGLPIGRPQDGSLWLDSDALCRQLHEITLRLRSGESPRRIGLPEEMQSELSQRLGKHLLKLWRTGAQRAFKRYPAPGTTMQVVAGVSAIHRMLEWEPQPTEPDADSEDSVSIRDIEPLFAAPAAVSASHWTIGNDSAAGLALSGTPDAPLNLKVGDALGLCADDAATWSLAVIRWIRMLDARQVELGVERLSPQMHPAWVRPLRGRRKASPEPALFVPGLPALRQPDRLLLPRHLYQLGMDAEVWHGSHQYTLSFGRRHENTPGFDLIEFNIIASESRHD
jgi:hypothetical protein